MAKSASFGLQIGDQQPSTFEKQASMQQPFQDAHRDYVPLELEEEGSAMVKGDGQNHEMRPDPSIAEDQDRLTFNEKWQAEQDAADARMLEKYLERLNPENENTREQDRDHNLNWGLGD